MGADSRLQPEGRVWRISEQAHSTSSHTALLPTAAHPLLLSALPEGCLSPSVPSTFPLRIHISQSSSTYFTFPGLSNYKELSPQGRGRGETKRRNLSSQPLPTPSIWGELLGMNNKGAGVSVVPNMR